MKHLLNMVLLGSFRLAKTAIICQSTTSVADAVKKLRVKMHYTVIQKKIWGVGIEVKWPLLSDWKLWNPAKRNFLCCNVFNPNG